jgi:hypothetical protein
MIGWLGGYLGLIFVEAALGLDIALLDFTLVLLFLLFAVLLFRKLLLFGFHFST